MQINGREESRGKEEGYVLATQAGNQTIRRSTDLTSPRPEISTAIRNATDFVELCALYGYLAEEHVVQTKDGYLLGLHRLAWKRDEEFTKVNSGPDSVKKRVVYLHHGLLMNSEVWVCLTDAQRVLPFVLVEKGFDVWVCDHPAVLSSFRHPAVWAPAPLR